MAKKKQTRSKKRVLKAARLRLMPLTMAMLSLLLIVKVNDLYIGSRQLNDLLAMREASAADAKPDAAKSAPDAAAPAPTADAKPADAAVPADAKPADAAAPTDTKPADATAASDAKPADAAAPTADDKKADAGTKPPPEPKTFGAGKLTLKQVEALKAKEAAAPYTQTELDLLQNLSKRRDELDQRARDLELKSNVLDATEKRIDTKIADMKTLQDSLSKVVAEYKVQEDSQIKSLVKIYENMKPTDAANIFNELDMPILLQVIDRMSERKVAPVLASMDPKRARDVTQELAELRKGGDAAAAKAGK